MLRVHYPLHEDSGSTVNDFSGFGTDGTATGAGPSGTGTRAGPLGQTAYDFDGSDDYVQSDTDFNPVGDGQITLSAWINADTFSSTSQFFASWSIDNNNHVLISARDASFRASLQVSSNNVNTTMPGTANTGQWYHVSAVIDPSFVTLYVDGEQRARETNSLDASNITSNGPFILANRADFVGVWHDGLLADARLYDRALSPNEVSYLYEVGEASSFTSKTKTL